MLNKDYSPSIIIKGVHERASRGYSPSIIIKGVHERASRS
jgi:hypothetical protein